MEHLFYVSQSSMTVNLLYTSIAIFDYQRYLNEFKIIKRLGKGGFGEVNLGVHFMTG